MEHSLGMLPQTTNKARLVQDLFQELSHASLGSWYPTGQLGGVPEMWDDAYLPFNDKKSVIFLSIYHKRI